MKAVTIGPPIASVGSASDAVVVTTESPSGATDGIAEAVRGVRRSNVAGTSERPRDQALALFTMRTRFLIALAATVAIAGCGGSSTTAPLDITQVKFDSSLVALGVNIDSMSKTISGVYFRDVPPGTGATVGAGSTITVPYTGWLTNGKQFDTNSNLQFRLGTGQVIQGWDEGLQGMKVGGTRLLVIPPALGYGSSGSGSIPGNAWLVFRVQLLHSP